MNTQGEDGHPHTQDRELRRNQPRPHLEFGLPASRIVSQNVVFVTAAELTDTLSSRSKGSPAGAFAGRLFQPQFSNYHLRPTNSNRRIQPPAGWDEGEGPFPERPPQEAVRQEGPAPALDLHDVCAPSCSAKGRKTPKHRAGKQSEYGPLPWFCSGPALKLPAANS